MKKAAAALGNLVLRIIAFIIAIGIALAVQQAVHGLFAPTCDRCGKKVESTAYHAEGNTYCRSCANILYPHATWK